MLEGLDKVNWGDLDHAYGKATDVPGLLRELMAPNAEARDHALKELFGNIWHQGTVYEVTPFAVPFLYELLESPRVVDRAGTALLLSSIASGRGYFQVHAADEGGPATWRPLLEKDGRPLDEELVREAMVVGQVRRAISPKLPLLIPYLCHEERELRLGVAEALADYPEHAETSLAALEGAEVAEQDEEVRTEMRKSIARLKALGPQLARAVRHRDIGSVRSLLARGVDPNARDTEDVLAPVLVCAAGRGHAEIVQLLLQAGADPNAGDGSDLSALDYACAYGYREVAQALLAGGADPNRRSMDGQTPIFGAAEDGYTEIIQDLLDAGAQVDLQDETGTTTLMVAAERGWPETVEFLLRHGTDPSLADAAGNTALQYAEEAGNADTVELLTVWNDGSR